LDSWHCAPRVSPAVKPLPRERRLSGFRKWPCAGWRLAHPAVAAAAFGSYLVGGVRPEQAAVYSVLLLTGMLMPWR